MGFFSWFLGFLFRKKDRLEKTAKLEEKEGKSESKKSRLRLKEDKLRLKQADTQRKEKGIVGKEVEEIKEALRAGTIKAERRDVKKLLQGDEKILRKLLRYLRLASRVQKTARKIEREDKKEIKEEAQISGMTGRQSSGVTPKQQDIQSQERLKQSEEAEIQHDKKLFRLYKLKEGYEKKLLDVEKEMSGLYGFTKPDSDTLLFKPEFLRKKRARYNSLKTYKQQLLLKIRDLEQQILNYEGAKAA